MNQIGILQGRLTSSNGRGIQFFPYENWEHEFKIAREVGFECIELLVKKGEFSDNPLSSPSGIRRINELKKESGIDTPSVHGFYGKESNYPEILREIIKAAHQIGAKVVLISFFEENELITEDDKSLARSQLKEPLDLAESYGIRLGVETEISAEELKDFINSFNHPAIGIYYDTGNMVSMGVDVVKELKFLQDYLCGIHLKDREIGSNESVPLGEGDADFRAILGILKEISYTAPLIIQGARKEGVNDIELNKQYLEWIKTKF